MSGALAKLIMAEVDLFARDSTKGGATSSKNRCADSTPGWSLEISSSRIARMVAMPFFACSGCFLNDAFA